MLSPGSCNTSLTLSPGISRPASRHTGAPPIIVADAGIPAVEYFLKPLAGVEIRRLEAERIGPDTLADARGLLVRSVTRVDAQLLQGSPLEVVASAVSGTDHLDASALARAGIRWGGALGCNAIAVAEWVLTAMGLLALEQGLDLRRCRVGILGLGNAGGRLAQRLDALGVNWVACDPFLNLPGLVDLPEVLQADVISLHVPLTIAGAHPTRHLLGVRALAAMPPRAVLINASRGAVVVEDTLCHALGSGLCAALDVYEGEPEVSPELIAGAALASPHVAGHSLRGRLRGARAAAELVLRALGGGAPPPLPPPAPTEPLGGLGEVCAGEVEACGLPVSAMSACCPVAVDSMRLKALTASAASPAELARGFVAMRRDYPLRREFSEQPLVAEEFDANTAAVLERLGFGWATAAD